MGSKEEVLEVRADKLRHDEDPQLPRGRVGSDERRAPPRDVMPAPHSAARQGLPSAGRHGVCATLDRRAHARSAARPNGYGYTHSLIH